LNFGIWIAAVLLIVGCSAADRSADTPTTALRSYIEAQQKGDVAAMKRLLSRSSIEFIEKNARVQNRLVDDILRDETKVRIAAVPEMRNERIEGDTATVEVRDDQTGKFDLVYPLVREDGSWKLARDKQIEAILRKANEAREKLVSDIVNSSNSNSNSNTKR
jgi:hypothetical protein